MTDVDKTQYLFRYGQWVGNLEGYLPDYNRCAKDLWGNNGVSRQCYRKNGYGPGNAYCKQHAKMLEEQSND